MAALILYLLLICSTSIIMLLIIKSDNLDFRDYCDHMFDAKVIRKEHSMDKVGSTVMAINCHVVFLLLAVIYWVKRILNNKRGDE